MKRTNRRRRNLPPRPPRELIVANPPRRLAALIREAAAQEGVSVSRLLTEMLEQAIEPSAARRRGGAR